MNILPPNRCDQTLAKLKNCFDAKIEEVKLISFVYSQKPHRHDGLLFKELGIVKRKELSYIVKIILTRNHGPGAVECSFNHNIYVLTNVIANTIISKQLIKDQMLVHGIELYTIDIERGMIKYDMTFNCKKKRSPMTRMIQNRGPNLLLMTRKS